MMSEPVLERYKDILRIRRQAHAGGAVGECAVLLDGDDLCAVEEAWPSDGQWHGISYLEPIGSLNDVVDDLCERFQESDEWRKFDADDPLDPEARAFWIIEPEHMLAWAEHLELQAARIRDAVTAKEREQG